MSNWDKKKTGIGQKEAELASKGVNKPAGEVLKESWQNIKDVFSGTARANEQRQNKQRKDGGYPGNR
jgi:hypothetical protein